MAREQRLGTSIRKSIRKWCAAAAIAVMLAGVVGCAKKRPIPAPPPVLVPGPKQPEAPPFKPGAPPAPNTAPPVAFEPPDGCIAGPRAPWFRCRFESGAGEAMVYYLALPPSSARAAERVPLVMVLHGSSGSGPGDGKPLDGGHRFATALWVSEDVQARHPSIVLVPQAEPRPGETWVRAWRAPAADDPLPKESLVLAMEVLSMLRQRYPIDGQRLYLTGQSMGGFGAWLAYTRYPGYFAAIVPVCGGGDPAAVVPNPTAVWAFHGVRDAAVPVSRAREMVAAIKATGSPVRYREYPGLDHNIFNEAYAEPELVEWLFDQRLPQTPGPP